MEVIYNGFVVEGQHIRDVLEQIDADLPGSDVIVTGGDRYRDEDGNIRSSSNHEIVRRSAPNSYHIGSMAVDYTISNMTMSDEFNLDYFDWGYSDINKQGYTRFHGDLRYTGMCYE